MKTAQYVHLKFKNRKVFETWLEEKTKYIVKFEDGGQDFLTWWIDENGEVLHSKLQDWMWNGKIVNLKSLKVGKNLKFQNGDSIKYKIKEIEKTEKGGD